RRFVDPGRNVANSVPQLNRAEDSGARRARGQGAYPDQSGAELEPTVVSCSAAPPARASIEKICGRPVRVEAKATRRPSGEKLGDSLDPEPDVSRTLDRVTRSRTAMSNRLRSARVAKASRVPSGLQDAPSL